MSIPLFFARVRRAAPFALVFASAAVSVGAYLQGLNYQFESDDRVYIITNTKLSGLHLTELWRLFIEPYNAYEFLPLRDLSYWFDIALFGMNPAAFRVHNILLYLICLPLAYATTLGLWRYFRQSDVAGARWAAASVTALFALHPALVESVVWISGRKDILSTMFSLLAMWLAVNTKREQGLSSRYAAATLLALMAAMLSKATAVMVAPVVALLWVTFWRDISKQGRNYYLLLWPIASLILATCVALIFSSHSTIREPVYWGIEAVTRALAVLGWLARLAVSPESRHFYYPVLDDPHLSVMVALGLAVLAVTVAGGVMILRKRSLEWFALSTFFLLCIPYIQLIPYRTHSLVADRFLAFAAWPAVLLIVGLALRLKPAPRIVILAGIALSWGYQTIERPRDWRNTVALFDSDLRANPGYYLPAAFKIIFNQLPNGLYREAEGTAANISTMEFREAMIGLVKADYAAHVMAVDSGNPQEATKLLWKLEQDIKLPAQAQWNSPMKGLWEIIGVAVINEWEFLAKKFPDDEAVHYNAGLWLLKVGKYEDAVVHFRAATGSSRLLQSARGVAFRNLGVALLGAGHIAEAEVPLRAALEQSPPDFFAYCSLSGVYRQTGRMEEAAHAETECRSRSKIQRSE